MNQFVATLWEKVFRSANGSVLRRPQGAGAEFKAFDKIMKRPGGKPRDGDQLPHRRKGERVSGYLHK